MDSPSLLRAAIEGLLLGASLIIAIGAQNAFVLRQGLQRHHVFAVATVCAASDIVLIGLGVAGLGALINAKPVLIAVATGGGALFLFAYGALALRRAFDREVLHASDDRAANLVATLGACLAFTFLNPHVYLDTVVLVGALSARYPGDGPAAFGAGAAVASLIWFYGLAYGARLLAPIFATPAAWRILDVAIAVVMWGIALSLAGEALVFLRP